MECHTSVHRQVGLECAFSFKTDTYVSDLDMTAGVIIPCMPSLAALVRHLRPSVSTYLGKYRTTFRGLIQSHKQTKTCDSDSSKAFSVEHEHKYAPMIDESVHSAQAPAARAKTSQPPADVNPHGQIRKITEFHVTHAPYKVEARRIRPPGGSNVMVFPAK